MSKPDWIQVGVPTLDRPFGLQLWPIFEKAYESAVGYKPQDFRFVPGETTLSTIKSCTAILISYYIIIFGGRELMRGREPFKLNFLFKVHNFYLTAISAILLGLFLEQIIPTVARHGIFFAVCDHAGGWTDKMVILYYVGAVQRHAVCWDDANRRSSTTLPSFWS
jgi:fatty acid elongase 3